MLSRRDLLLLLGQGYVGARLAPLTGMLASFAPPKNSMRCINVVNFIRAVEPRFKMDMMLSVRNQMELILKYRLSATWLLQYDALVSGPFVGFLKERMAKDHEVGFWFEMNEMHVRASGVEWRGRPGYEWDYFPSVAFTLGYSKEDRVKLADTAMREFKKVWGRYPSSVASWNLDAFTIDHLVEHYDVDAFAVCRDQIATDGFTIWGAPIAGYYPSKTNCWSPALDRHNQISAPVFRMLGQDPVYYYDRVWRMPGKGGLTTPDTMEPVWPSGQSPTFVREFLDMIEKEPALGFAYAQIGQENSFPWDQQEPGYEPQMVALSKLRERGVVHVETMGESGRRFKKAFKETPAQAQVMPDDSFGNTDPSCASIWYQSRFYRANLHIKGGLPYLRDLTVYSDRMPQPHLDEPTRENEVEQRMPAILDGYHWRKPDSLAGGFFLTGDDRLRLTGKPEVKEDGASLEVRLPVQDGHVLRVRFDEQALTASLDGGPLTLSFEWDPPKAALKEVRGDKLLYGWHGLEYEATVGTGTAEATPSGCRIRSHDDPIRLRLAQKS
ncbi:MAG TPA: hypothetical protein VHE55_17650 [Fimbriimonadaceae bacterium]|nr:hypothetical protein [Fimbriimonadaceae bacterium]